MGTQRETWQDNGSNQWSRHQSTGDQMDTNWVSREREGTPAGGISGTCTHLQLCNAVSHGWTDEFECFPIESDVHGSSG